MARGRSERPIPSAGTSSSVATPESSAESAGPCPQNLFCQRKNDPNTRLGSAGATSSDGWDGR